MSINERNEQGLIEKDEDEVRERNWTRGERQSWCRAKLNYLSNKKSSYLSIVMVEDPNANLKLTKKICHLITPSRCICTIALKKLSRLGKNLSL